MSHLASGVAGMRTKYITGDYTVDPWTDTTAFTKTSTGEYSDTVTVDGTKSWEYRAKVENEDGEFSYGSVLTVSTYYYGDSTQAYADRCRGVWYPDVSADADDHVQSNDGVGHGTYSKVDDGGGAFHIDFGNDGYIEIPVVIDRTNGMTFALYYSHTATSGDHTVMSNGTNVLSYASDMANQQIELNGGIVSISGEQPVTTYTPYFIVVDPKINSVKLYKWNGSAIVEVRSMSGTLSSDGQWIRIARGAPGDNNHQDNEYAPDMNWKELGYWIKVLSDVEMEGVADAFTGGYHIV
jgi:hypothetical protein